MESYMKKVIATTVFLILSQTALANHLSEGQFQGKGIWKKVSTRGDYQVRTEITGNQVATTYTLPDGKSKNWEFMMDEDENSNGFFKVVSQGSVLGTGYCLENTELCHYEITVKTGKIEETITLQHGILYKFGSFNGNEKIFWQEELKPI